MRILIRADSSDTIGYGHVMRCLTLAASLSDIGFQCRFLCRDLPGNAGDIISARGYQVNFFEWGDHCHQSQDIGATLQYAGDWCADWIIADHYELDVDWERSVRDRGYRILVLDDWPHRHHDCDMLLDHNLGADKEQYSDWVNPDCQIISGSTYALIRSEFSRKSSRPVRRGDRPVKIFLNMGGADHHGITDVILDHVSNAPDGLISDIRVLVNERSISYGRIRDKISTGYYPFIVKLLPFTDAMCDEYDQADIAIGAGGVSILERASRALPSALVIIADNQRASSEAAVSAGIAVKIADFTRSDAFDSAVLFDLIASPEKLNDMRACAQRLVDVNGSDRVARELLLHSRKDTCLIRASAEDSRLFYSWQREPGARRFFRNTDVPRWSEHQSWFIRTINSNKTVLYKIMLYDSAMGYVRIDYCSRSVAEISVLVARRFRGFGIASYALNVCCGMHSGLNLRAEIKAGNYASRRSFRRVGFQPSGKGCYVRKRR